VRISEDSPKTILVEIRTGGPSDTRDEIKTETHIEIKDTLIDEKGAVVE
jgi:hypothetical protein